MHNRKIQPRTEEGIGARIYQWRIKHDESLHSLSIRSGVSYSLLWCVETGQKELSRLNTVNKLANAMNVHPAWLAYGIKCNKRSK